MSSTKNLRIICLAIIVFGLLAAGYGLLRRISAEHSANIVEIVVDYPEVEGLAAAQGVSVDEAMIRLHAAGATAAALPEDTLSSLEAEGQLSMGPRIGWSLAAERNPSDPAFLVIAANQDIKKRVLTGLQRVYSPESIFEYPGNAQSTLLMVHGTKLAVGELGLGLSPEKVSRISKAGLHVVPRLRDIPDATPDAIRASIAAVAAELPEVKDGPKGIVIFDGTNIPGNSDMIPKLADALTANGLVYGSIEFGKQKGDQKLGAKLNGQLVRVHSITQEEVLTLKRQEAVQRFGLAVKDRNIRVLYIHFPSLTGVDPIAIAESYLKDVANEVKGVSITNLSLATDKSAHPFKKLTTPSWLLFLLFAAAGAGLLLWLIVIFPAELPRKYIITGYILIVLGLFAAAGAAFAAQSPGRILFGLLAAIGFPLLSLTWAYHRVNKFVERRPARIILPAIGVLLVTTLITLIGAFLIAAMMGDTRYLVKVGQFTGVKAALAIPLLIFAVLIACDGIARAGESLADYYARCNRQLREFMGQPLYLWGVAIAVIALAAVALMLARSGNEGGVGVSAMELKFRALLDQLVIARPRTKEFIVGFPLFLFSMVAAANRRRQLALVLLLGSAIGQIDVLNTYCHAHTPFLLSLLRTFNGLWIGIVIAVVLLAIFGRRLLTIGRGINAPATK